MVAYLLIEHSREDASAHYRLIDKDTWDIVHEQLNENGWLEQDVDPIVCASEKAQFGKVTDLLAYVTRFQIEIAGEQACWSSWE